MNYAAIAAKNYRRTIARGGAHGSFTYGHAAAGRFGAESATGRSSADSAPGQLDADSVTASGLIDADSAVGSTASGILAAFSNADPTEGAFGRFPANRK